jgi:hypothetical protein
VAATAKRKAAPGKSTRYPYGVYAYFPSRLAFTPEGDAKEKLVTSLAKECGGVVEGAGTGGAWRDLSFMFKTKKNAQRFLRRLATRKIKRGSIIDYTKPPHSG